MSFINWLRSIICEPCSLPEYKVYSIPYSDLANYLQGNGLINMVKSEYHPDNRVYFTSKEGWISLIPYLTFSAEVYADSERRDCDDYSKKASAEGAFKFGLEVIQVWGDTPLGPHAFNLVIYLDETDNFGCSLFEPNAGFECAGELLVFNNNSYGWIAKSWKP